MGSLKVVLGVTLDAFWPTAPDSAILTPSTFLLLSLLETVEIAPLAALTPTGPDSAIRTPLHFPIIFSIENH